MRPNMQVIENFISCAVEVYLTFTKSQMAEKSLKNEHVYRKKIFSTCTKTLADHILTNFPENVIQKGVVEMRLSD